MNAPMNVSGHKYTHDYTGSANILQMKRIQEE